ncbi:ChrR family anti-sigma-E factor [Marinibacterium profundimaris]|uniref:Transcriptional regulator n=1 Tax=Marinibacterium profundimaris TaxID=1679460 RepID=A0A225NST4_9RHOB|nr:ChrR family anti-sigma-E factor [Marinibacterium profundimaris]OWU76087.1 transcriptional regulator [Marinibacterium profundimaris]
MTNEIRHHLTDAILMAYAAGSLNEAFSLMVATHVSLCDECRARLESYDALGGALLDGIDADAQAPVAEDSLAATLARIAASDAGETAAMRPAPAPRGSVLPAPLRDYVGGDLEAIRWRPVGMGVKQAILKTGPGATARLLFIPAGTAMPDHGHHGTEMTMVLQGAFSDEDDHFARGDVEIADEEMQHTPVADISEDCICLAVTDASLRFTSLLPRLAQPFLRI